MRYDNGVFELLGAEGEAGEEPVVVGELRDGTAEVSKLGQFVIRDNKVYGPPGGSFLIGPEVGEINANGDALTKGGRILFRVGGRKQS